MAAKIPSLLHTMSPTFQKAWYKRNKMPLPPHLTGSVAQASKEVKPSERVKKLQAKSIQAYGATKGTRMGSDDGSGEAIRDTIAPLTRDQHSKVQAAARAAKAAAPAKPKRPLSKSERIAAIAAAVRKRNTKYDVPTVNPDDADHEDLRDIHQSLHISRGYNEEVELDEAKGADFIDKINAHPLVHSYDGYHLKLKPLYWHKDTKEKELRYGTQKEVKTFLKNVEPDTRGKNMLRSAASSNLGKAHQSRISTSPIDLTKMKKEQIEIEQINEIGNTERGVQRLRDYLASDRSKVKIKDVIAAKRSENPEKELNKLGMRQSFKAKAQAKVRAADAAKNPKPTPKASDWRDDVYPRRADGKPLYYHSDSVELEGPTMNEVTKKEAEAVLGGPTREKPKGPAGKHPLGYRLARSAARKAMKGGIAAVHKSMEKTMAKEEVEQVVEQDDSMEKKEMAQTQLHFMAYAAKEILEFIDMGGEIEEWYQNKLSKVQSEVESLHSYIEGEKRRTGMVKEEEQIDEKAPPGAKYERMVKHIKKGYAKDGLTKQEKGIAYATAWKAYGKKEEVETEENAEQVDEKYMGFKKVMAAAKAGGARDPAAVAASIGRKKYGKEKFQAAAAAGKKMGEEVEQVEEGAKDWKKAFSSVAQKNLHQDTKKMQYKVRRRDLVGLQPKVDTTPKVTATTSKRGTYSEEVMTEAEGTIAVTPKEKALAAHHGDKSKITYGDVIKARLKSAAAKAMKKGN